MDLMDILLMSKLTCHGGLPYWEIVGLPDTSVKESKERVKTAIKNSKFELESRRIIINLAPADTKKEGAFYDLPIAIGILKANEIINKANFDDTIFIGELSLDLADHTSVPTLI